MKNDENEFNQSDENSCVLLFEREGTNDHLLIFRLNDQAMQALGEGRQVYTSADGIFGESSRVKVSVLPPLSEELFKLWLRVNVNPKIQ